MPLSWLLSKDMYFSLNNVYSAFAGLGSLCILAIVNVRVFAKLDNVLALAAFGIQCVYLQA